MPDDPENLILKVLQGIQATIAGTNARLDAMNETLGGRIDQTNQRLDQTNQRLDQLIAFTANGFTALGTHMVKGFADVDRRFVETHERIDALARPAPDDRVEARLRTIEDHLGLPR